MVCLLQRVWVAVLLGVAVRCSDGLQPEQRTVPPLPARRFDHQEEGASLRRMINQFTLPIKNEGRWEVFYDDASGFPYFHDTQTGLTQWENPWGGSEGNDDGFLQSSWTIYERFRFKGLFDDLTAVRHRRKLPRASPNLAAMRSIANMAGMQFDVAQARLEVAILKTEARAGREDAPKLPPGASGEQGQTTTAAAGSQADRPSASSPRRGGDEGAEEPEEDLVAMAMEEEGVEMGETVTAGQVQDTAAGGPAVDDGGVIDASGVSHSPAMPWSGVARGRSLSHPPPGTTPGQRIALAGGWNDLANMWYARGEWELAIECFRRSLFWNPEQTAAIVNLASLLVRLGFERDAAVVWDYFVDVDGGTMGGWTAESEEALVASIEGGLQLAAQLPGSDGRTLGELRLQQALPTAEDVVEAAGRATAEADLSAVLLSAAGGASGDDAMGSVARADVVAAGARHEEKDQATVRQRQRRTKAHAAAADSHASSVLPPPVVDDLRTLDGAASRVSEVEGGSGARCCSGGGLDDYRASVGQRLAMDASDTGAVLHAPPRWLWGVIPLSNDPARPYKDIVGWAVALCFTGVLVLAALAVVQGDCWAGGASVRRKGSDRRKGGRLKRGKAA